MGMEAEQAVHDAIKGLVASGKRVYAHNVPLAAENLPVRR
jgi:protein involved in ribonucleotide reduction